MSRNPYSSRPTTDFSCSHESNASTPNFPTFTYAFHAPGMNAQNAGISEEVLKNLSRLHDKGLPDCLRSARHAKLWLALIRHTFAKLSSEARQEIVASCGGNVGNYLSQHAIFNHDNTPEQFDIVDWATQKLNRPPLLVSIVIGRLMNMRPEYVCMTFPPTDNSQHRVESNTPVTVCIPQRLIADNDLYILRYREDQLDFSGNIEYAVCHYSSMAGDNAFLLAARVNGMHGAELKIGLAPAPNWLFSRVEMARHQTAHVFLCLDLPVAMHMIRLWKECRAPGKKNCIISGCFGPEKNACLNELQGHPVTIIPPFTHEGFLDASSVAERCKKAGATSVSVYPFPILAEGVPAERLWGGDSSPWKQLLQDKAVDLDAVEMMSQLVTKLKNTALSPADYERHKAALGLVPHQEVSFPEGNNVLLPVTELDEVDVKPDLDFDTAPTLSTLIQPGYLFFLWGGSDSGKSFITLTFTIALATGTGAFCCSNDAPPRKVLVLDGELTKAQFSARLKQLSPTSELYSCARQNIILMLARDPEVGEYSLNDKDFQSKLLFFIEKNNIEVVVVDNLITLFRKATKGGEDILFDFFYKIERAGAAVVYVNHATKDNESFKGSSDLGSKSQTIIHVEGRNELSADEHASDAIKAALTNNDGAVVRLNFTKCKLPPKLNGKSEVYHLPIGGRWQRIEGDVPGMETLSFSTLEDQDTLVDETPTEALPLESTPVSHAVPAWPAASTTALSHDERRLFELFDGTDVIKRKDLENTLEWGEDKSVNILKKLKTLGCIKAIGSGRNITYVKA